MPTKGTRIGSGAGKGEGWGGEAKGAGKPAEPFTAASPGRVSFGAAATSRAPGELSGKQRDEARAAELRDHLYALAKTAERQETQLSATVAFLNRVEGMPVARQQIAGDPDGNPVQHAVVIIPCKSGD